MTFLDLDVVIPVHNEQAAIEQSVRAVHEFLSAGSHENWQITVADNASTDDTARLADELACSLQGVRVLHLDRKGRGLALKAAWSSSPARVLAYLDVDLSTDLRALEPLIAPLFSGHSDLAIGTRLASSSRIVRGSRREFISRSYNVLLHATLGAGFSDAQCGFKALTRAAADALLPLVEDDAWFFDTELLLIAEAAGLRVHEVPVDWLDDPASSVAVVKTAADDLRGMIRVGRGLSSGRIPIDGVYAALGRQPLRPEREPSLLGQIVRFAIIGGISTAVYALLYLVFALVMSAQASNFAALALTTIANTSANRRFTFGVRGPKRALLHQLQGIAIFLLAWLVTSSSLTLLHSAWPEAPVVVELAVLTVANLVATVLRFVLMRLWVFRSRAADVIAPARIERFTRDAITSAESIESIQSVESTDLRKAS